MVPYIVCPPSPFPLLSCSLLYYFGDHRIKWRNVYYTKALLSPHSDGAAFFFHSCTSARQVIAKMGPTKSTKYSPKRPDSLALQTTPAPSPLTLAPQTAAIHLKSPPTASRANCNRHCRTASLLAALLKSQDHASQCSNSLPRPLQVKE